MLRRDCAQHVIQHGKPRDQAYITALKGQRDIRHIVGKKRA